MRDFQTAGARAAGGALTGTRRGKRRRLARRDFQQQARRAAGQLAAARADRVVAAGGVETAFEGVFRAHLHLDRRVGPVVDEEDVGVLGEGPARDGMGGLGRVGAEHRQALVRIDRADRLPDGAVARDADRVQHLFARGRQVDGVAELDLDLARLPALRNRARGSARRRARAGRRNPSGAAPAASAPGRACGRRGSGGGRRRPLPAAAPGSRARSSAWRRVRAARAARVRAGRAGRGGGSAAPGRAPATGLRH